MVGDFFIEINVIMNLIMFLKIHTYEVRIIGNRW